MSRTTVRSIIDAARVRHWAFSHLQVGDGAVLLFLRSRLVTHVATHGAKIEGLVGTTLSYAIPVALPTVLVTNDGATLNTNYGQDVLVNTGVGTPQVAAPYADGWPVHLSDGGVPYVDFGEPAIAGDPFGIYGGTPGFPLPTEMVRLISVSLVYGDDCVIPCDVVPEAQRHVTRPGRNPACFSSGNRLVPIEAGTTIREGSRWARCSAIQISYVGVQTLTSLDDVLNLPTVLAEALVADVAQYLAQQAKDVPAADRAGFEREATRCGAIIGGAALGMLHEPQRATVHYRGR